MLFKELDKCSIIKEAQALFLETLPLSEIDNEKVRAICKQYREELTNAKAENCNILFQNYSEYLYEWAYNNWMTDVFYFQR